MSKNYCIIRNEKIKSVSSVKRVIDEMLPDEDKDRNSPRADTEYSYLNDNSATSSQAFEDYKNLLPKNVRKNAVMACMQVVSTSEEFESSDEEKRYYEEARKFIEQKFGKIVAWSIHRDETSTHMQTVTIPLVDGKLNARALIGGSKYKMKEIQDDFYNEVGEQFGLERGEENSKAVHVTAEQYHKEQLKKLNEEKEELEKKKKELEAEEKRLSDVEKRLSERSAEQNRQITQTNEQIADFNKSVKQFNYSQNFDKQCADAVGEMVKQGNYSEKSSSVQLFGALKAVTKKFFEMRDKVRKVLRMPIDEIINHCKKAKEKGCANLEDYFFPKVEQKQKIENVKSQKKVDVRGR